MIKRLQCKPELACLDARRFKFKLIEAVCDCGIARVRQRILGMPRVLQVLESQSAVGFAVGYDNAAAFFRESAPGVLRNLLNNVCGKAKNFRLAHGGSKTHGIVQRDWSCCNF
jgi:hypothetical protein